jgi:zinc protease
MIRRVFAATFALLLAGPLWAAIPIQEVTSPGGIRAWLVEDHSLPFAALELRFRGGTSLDAPGKRGAINLMTGLIEEGAGDLDAQGFAAAQEALGASFGFDTGDDALAISARFLTQNRDEALALLKSGLTETRFDQDAIERVKGQVLSIIRADAQDPQAIAGERFGHDLFGDHPYGTSQNGTPETLATLTRDDMFDAKARVMARDRLYVAAAGDITPAELGPLLDALLGGLPATGAPFPPPPDLAIDGGTAVVDYDSPQSVVIFGQSGLRRDDPDFFAAYILNQIVGGGGFSARLMKEVREKRGLTYGIETYLVDRDLADTWQGSFASANEKVAEAIGVVRTEWARAAADGVTEAELTDAKTYLTGSYPLRFSGNEKIANILVGMQLKGLPADYVNTRNARVEAVTVADVQRVAQRIMTPDDLYFVVVGRPVGLK